MNKHDKVMPSLEVIIERLPEAVIAALVGPIVKQDFESLQSLPVLDMKTVAMLLRRKIHLPMPPVEVVLERLPESVMTSLTAKTKGPALVQLNTIIQPKHSLSTKMLTPKIVPKQKHVFKRTTRKLEVSLKRLPEAAMTSLLSPRKAKLLAAKTKTTVSRTRKMHATQKPSITKAALII